MIGIYHSRDFDGMASGAILLKKYPDIKLIGWDYGQPIPEMDDDIIIMCDVSFDDKSEMDKIKHKLIWIDHHISAIEKHDKDIQGLRDTNFAACELTWKYFFPDLPIPYIITQLGKYDSWRQDEEWDTVVMPIQMVMKAWVNSPQTFPEWAFHLHEGEDMGNIRHSGVLMLQAKENLDIQKCKNVFYTTIDGYKAVCLNAGAGSQVYKSVKEPYDIMCSFMYSGKYWTVSFYSTIIDVSQLALRRGGGGHKGAAGCQMTTNQLQEMLGI